MGRVWITGAANGKVRVLLGSAAVRERRRVGREIDATIARALQGDLGDGDLGAIERLASLADSVARGKAG
jgi:hypothetical protein